MIIETTDLLEKLISLKKLKTSRKGVSTGFDEMDDLLYLSKQYLMVLTGLPGCGKSEFLDAIALNTAILHDWNWLYFSPENYPLEEHLKKIVERKLGDRLLDCDDKKIMEAVQWASDRFSWIHPEEEAYTINDVLAETETRIHEGKKVDVLVIDPWNELNHSIQAGLRDDQYIGKILTKVRQFHRKYNILTCIIIHPHNILPDKTTGKWPVPHLSNCNGGAMWRAKADFGICVHCESMQVNEMDVYIQKVKFKSMGKVGACRFQYDFLSGRFKSPLDACFSLPEPNPF